MVYVPAIAGNLIANINPIPQMRAAADKPSFIPVFYSQQPAGTR